MHDTIGGERGASRKADPQSLHTAAPSTIPSAALLIEFGWTQDRQKGSHVTFVKQGEFPVTVPVHDGKVGRVYLTSICDRLEIDG